MKTGLKLWSTNTGDYYNEAQRLYAKGYFDYIELYVVPDSLDTLEKWHQLKIPFNLHAPHFMSGFNLADHAMALANKITYQQVRMFADRLDAKYIVFHAGMDGNLDETIRQLSAFNESRAVIENTPLRALPNHLGGMFCRGSSPEEIRQIMQKTGCGFCLDFGHAICAANSNQRDGYAYIADFCKLHPTCFHLSDTTDITSEYDMHLHLGHGVLDIRSILKQVRPLDWLTIETDKCDEKSLMDFEGDVEWLRNLK